MRVRCGLAALSLLSIVPAWPDIVDISVSGELTGSGNFVTRCDSCGGTDTGTFSFDGSTTSLGIFNRSGSASFTEETAGRSISIIGQTQLTTEATSTGFTVDQTETSTFDATGAEWGAEIYVVNGLSFDFTLTTESVMDLDVTAFNGWFGGLTDLTGLQNGFLLSLSSVGNYVLTLEPGTYQLTSGVVDDDLGSPAGPFTNEMLSADISLQADFTAVTPEPWGVSTIFPGLFIVGAVFTAVAWRRVRRYDPRLLS
jgi:hypothetical protein